ncbi:MAG TPA: glycosyltransferase family 2 protein [Candidatus Dormibacteraeota bacterium]
MATLELNAPSGRSEVGHRLLEAVPGLTSWTLLLAPAWVSIVTGAMGLDGAYWIAVAILAFDCYWLVRSLFVITNIYRTWFRLRHAMATDWLAKCEEPVGEGRPQPLDYYHLAIIPTYTEPYHVLQETVRAIADAAYPTERKLVAVITRETDEAGWGHVARLREEFGSRLAAFYHVKDPLEPGIVIGKSAAMNWGGRWMHQVLLDEGYDPSLVLVTDLDSDYRVHRQYLPWVSYHHAREEDRDCVLWQPVPLFHNNIWRVPTAVRVMSASTTQWQMYLHSRPARLVAFSSYTCSLKFVHDAGYWDKDVIPEDSRFYWKAFFSFGTRFRVKPLYLPLYGDSPTGRDYAAAHLSQYNQIKRWAWGITDIPYVLERLFGHAEIPLRARLRRFFNLYVNHVNWVFLPVLLMFGASMPIWVSTDFSLTTFGENVWGLSTAIVTCTLATVVALIYLEARMLPPKPKEWSLPRRLVAHLQYFAYPAVGLVLSVIPALEAHTRLLFGQYLEYKITEKGV